MGWKSLLYLLLSFWINDTIFVQGSKNFADHWVDDQVTHTNSYYGFFNLVNFNIGYHREHHDFPYVTGRYLPLVRKIAIEFYSDPRYIEKSIFTNIYCMLLAERGFGLKKFANKLTYNLKQLEDYRK
uniref:Fatty acid desaturase domain-containing protein n=1 Tax=Romanomermis culicivorax TaxID=13658 RepID=A0A915HNP8_ROMCU